MRIKRAELGVYILFGLFVFSIPWETAVEIPGAGSLAKVIGFLSLIAVAFRIIARRRLRKFNIAHFLLLGFILWATLSIFWSVDVESTYSRISQYYQLFMVVWMSWELTDSQKHLDTWTQCYVLGCYIAAIAVLSSSLSGTFYVQNTGANRYSAFGRDPNELGLILALGVPLSWRLMSLVKNRALAVLNALYIPLAVLSIVLTASRGAFICLAVSFVYVIWTIPSQKPYIKVMMALIVVAAAVGLPNLVPQSTWGRITTIGSEVTQGNLDMRTVIWKDASTIFNVHPLLGIGAGSFQAAVSPLFGYAIFAHNTYLSILVEDGLVGFLFFGTTLIVLISFICRLSPENRKLWTVLFLTWAVGVFDLTWDYRKPTWLMIAFIVSAYAIKKESDKEYAHNFSRKRQTQSAKALKAGD